MWTATSLSVRRSGARNQRRTPLVVNTAFLQALMWNGRFNAPSRDPFDNSKGFVFPAPEGTTRFPPNDPIVKHLLQAQAHIPPTELVEVTGFKGTRGTIGPRFDQFDNHQGLRVPMPDGSGFRNEPIRQKVLKLLNDIPGTASCSAISSRECGAAIRSTSTCSASRSPSSSSR